MSSAPSTSNSNPNFASIFNTALESYRRKTKVDLASQSLLPRLESCDSSEAVLIVLREQFPMLSGYQNRNDDRGLARWVIPTVNVLCTFSGTISQGVGMVSRSTLFGKIFRSNISSQTCPPPAAVVFTGIGVLLSVRDLRLSSAISLNIQVSRLSKMRVPFITS